MTEPLSIDPAQTKYNGMTGHEWKELYPGINAYKWRKHLIKKGLVAADQVYYSQAAEFIDFFPDEWTRYCILLRLGIEPSA